MLGFTVNAERCFFEQHNGAITASGTSWKKKICATFVPLGVQQFFSGTGGACPDFPE